jgi:hypothetical protein
MEDVLRDPERPEADGFHETLNYWLKTLSPNFHLDLNTLKRDAKDVISLPGKTNEYGGAGFTQALPVVTSLLLLAHAEEIGAPPITLLLENPENNLHPKAQFALGRLMAAAAAAGLQMVVETQSDHIFDGVRSALLDEFENLDPEDVIAYYFSRNRNTGKTEITPVAVEESGFIERAPDGFFDQSLKSVARWNAELPTYVEKTYRED